MNIPSLVIGLAAGLFIGILACILYRNKKAKDDKEKIANAEEEALRIINDAIKSAESKKREATLEAKEEILRSRKEYEKEEKERRADLQKQERRLQQKEENIDRKTDAIEKKEEALAQKHAALDKENEEIKIIKRSQTEMLERISGLTADQAKEYLEVLDRQSARLKKLTEDLVEASKASTGNLTVDLQPTDVNVLLTQTAGEYQEKLAARDLSLVLTPAPEAPKISADGRLLWRVFENLFSNIQKYALAGTRVYLTCQADENEVTITFRNISATPLNISADELMERFVRGDTSRNTEGSGLGLSIARSLTQLQHGTFSLTIDGDLFKAQLRFPRLS